MRRKSSNKHCAAGFYALLKMPGSNKWCPRASERKLSFFFFLPDTTTGQKKQKRSFQAVVVSA